MTKHSECGISVLMPVHNGGKHLAPAVASILEQTHKKLELIIIDDYSSDSAILELVKDDRIRIIKSPERGIVHALNAGIEVSQYPIIARMDGDDIALPERLEIQLSLLLSGAADIVGAQVELFCDDAEIAGGYLRYQNWINQQTSPGDIEANFWIESCIPHPTAMLHKAVLIKLGGYQNSTWPEDYDLWCRAHLAGYRFCKPDEQVLLKWRDYPERTSRVDQRYNDEQFLRCKAFYLSKLLNNKNIREVSIWGTGPNGTKLCHYMAEQEVDVHSFIDVNPALQGREKLGKPIHVMPATPSREDLSKIGKLGLVAVRSWGARERIREALLNTGYQELNDFIVVA